MRYVKYIALLAKALDASFLQRPLERRYHPLRPQLAHARVPRHQAGLVLEVLLHAHPTFRRRPHDLDMWAARRPQIDRAGAVAVGIVPEDADRRAADRR